MKTYLHSPHLPITKSFLISVAVSFFLFIFFPALLHYKYIYTTQYIFFSVITVGLLATYKRDHHFINERKERISDKSLTLPMWGAFILLLIFSLIPFPVYRFFMYFKKTRVISNTILYLLCVTALWIFGLKINLNKEAKAIKKKLKGKKCIYLSTHESSFDYFIIICVLMLTDCQVVAGTNLLKFPVFGLYLKYKAILVNRGSLSSSKKMLSKVKQFLDEGIPSVIFGEGGRKREGEIVSGVILREFKGGAFKIVDEYKEEVSIVPIIIDGSMEYKPPMKGDQNQKQWWNNPGSVEVIFMEPLTQGKMSQDEFGNYVHDTMVSEIKRRGFV